MISEATRRKIKRLEIITTKLVDEVFAGKYESLFKGTGIEFAEFREYLPGDDVRSIDWNVTARFGKPFIKRNEEERELSLLLVVDNSPSLEFGSKGKTKRELASEIAALLAFSALRNHDKVGLLQFSSQVDRYLPPRKGSRHVLGLIRNILDPPQGAGTNVGVALKYLNRIHKKRAVVFLLSDFLAPFPDREIVLTSRRHDLSAFRLIDPVEENLPSLGRLRLRDLETGEVTIINTSDSSFRRQYSEKARQRSMSLRKRFDSAKVDYEEFRTDIPPTDILLKFFHRKKARHKLRRCS